ncbi:uncharacterized protein LOC114939999 [Nylanderia fulva]|uniref:uncharacterized protein LOC114939999 n=1 Tax=Nylanderia fulva TaxID=613905 RepID=UPI0010FB3F88|nr:uncharacterized protein LOC114939999 [Nylanderia fulva]
MEGTNLVFFRFFIPIYQMFYVAIADNWCSVMPQSWIIDINEQLCVWLSHGVNATKAMKKSLPPQASWEKVPYKYLLGPYDLFEEAKQKEKEAELVSSDEAKINDLQNKENILPVKRTRIPKIYDSFTDNTESADTDSISEKKCKSIPISLEKDFNDKSTLKQKNIVPNPSSNYKTSHSDVDIREKDTLDTHTQFEQDQCLSPFDINESQPLEYGDYLSQTEESFQDDIQKEKYSKKYSLKQIKKIKTFNVEEKQSPVVKHKKSYSAPQMQQCKNKVATVCNSMQNCSETIIINEKEITTNRGKDTQGSIMRTLDTVLAMNRKLDSMSVINRKLDSILGILDEQTPLLLTNCSLDLLPELPLNSMRKFKKFCNDLHENEELRKQFQKKIRSIGGKSAESHLVNCLVTTLTNKLATRLTWEGQRQTEGIKNSDFANVIIGTISNIYSSTNFYILKNKFSEWLRRAGDRY